MLSSCTFSTRTTYLHKSTGILKLMESQRPHTAKKPTPRKDALGYSAQMHTSTTPWGRVAALIGGVVILVALVTFISAPGSLDQTDSSSNPTDKNQNTELAGTSGRVSFVAVGDNLPDITIAEYADTCDGEVGDGAYDYAPLYAPLKPRIEAADLAYVKEETHLGGDEIGPRGWPSFNTTDSMADALVETGFDLVASATNHSYDWGNYGAVEHSRTVWNAQPVTFTGTASSQAEADEIATVTCNDITFALLDYTYGVNGFKQTDLPAYAVNFIDEERIRSDVARAHEIADVILVAMHWGTENQTEPDEDQLYYANLLTELEVDVVLGSHPHVIGPLEWMQSESGHWTLVAYSLGNFISHHDTPAPLNELEGMLSLDFVRGDDGEITVQNVEWTPLINHTQEGAYAVYPLDDYTNELAFAHEKLGELEDPLTWMYDTSAEIINSRGGSFTITD